MRYNRLEHHFVEHIPECLEPGVLYISMEYATAVHCCCCGCGKEVVTPFTPTDWKMTFDGETISLSPSIGNWNFACRSHYFIRSGQVIEAETWTIGQVESGHRKDRSAKARYYRTLEQTEAVKTTPDVTAPRKTTKIRPSFIKRCFGAIRRFWRNLR
nr:DUF6527 family protein [Leptolyngbya sp. FACHB-541]